MSGVHSGMIITGFKSTGSNSRAVAGSPVIGNNCISLGRKKNISQLETSFVPWRKMIKCDNLMRFVAVLRDAVIMSDLFSRQFLIYQIKRANVTFV